MQELSAHPEFSLWGRGPSSAFSTHGHAAVSPGKGQSLEGHHSIPESQPGLC